MDTLMAVTVTASPDIFLAHILIFLVRKNHQLAIIGRSRRSRTSQERNAHGKVYEYTVDLWVTSNVFLQGHRIRLEVSSSNFPRFDRNPNTGGTFAREGRCVPADQTVHHSAGHPSHLILPVVP